MTLTNRSMQILHVKLSLIFSTNGLMTFSDSCERPTTRVLSAAIFLEEEETPDLCLRPDSDPDDADSSEYACAFHLMDTWEILSSYSWFQADAGTHTFRPLSRRSNWLQTPGAARGNFKLLQR